MSVNYHMGNSSVDVTADGRPRTRLFPFGFPPKDGDLDAATKFHDERCKRDSWCAEKAHWLTQLLAMSNPQHAGHGGIASIAAKMSDTDVVLCKCGMKLKVW